MTFREDYLPFGFDYRRMLQEPDEAKGPRVPSSIHSTSLFYKNQHTTLMRMTLDHESPEFSDPGCPGDGCPGLTGPGMVALAFNSVSHQSGVLHGPGA